MTRQRGFITRVDKTTGALAESEFFDLDPTNNSAIFDVTVVGPSSFAASVPGLSIAVAKFGDALAPDGGFGGGDGVASLTQHTTGAGVAVEPDGDVLLAGSTGSRALIARFTPAGAPDAGWSATGLRTYELHDSLSADFPPPFEQLDVAIDPAGNYLVSGNVGIFSAGAAVARVKPDGNLDGSFAPGGATQILGAGFPQRVLVDGSDRILIAGGGSAAGKNAAFVYRLAGGTGTGRVTALPHVSPSPVAAGSAVTCSPGTIEGAGGVTIFRWPIGNSSHILGRANGGNFPTTDKDIGKSIGCEVLVNYGTGQRSGILVADNAAAVVAAQAPPVATPTPTPVPTVQTAAGVFSKLKAGKRGAATVELKLRGPATIAIAGKAGKIKAYSAKRTVTKAGTVRIALKPSAALKRALRSKKRLKVKVTLTLTSIGKKTTATKTVTAKR